LTPPPTVLHWPGAGSGGGTWAPSQLGTLATHLDADSLSLSDGDTVTTWTAISGLSFSCGSGITYDTNVLTKPVVSNDGLTSKIASLSNSFATAVDGFSVFFVSVPRQASVKYATVARWSHNGFRLMIYGQSGGFAFTSHIGQSVSGNDTLGNTATITGGTETIGNAYILGGIADIGTALTLSVDGTIYVNSSFGTAGDTFSNVNAAKAGFATNNNHYENFAADFGEIVALNRAISSSERQKLEGYLAHRWGLTANLPSSHPYKSIAP